MGNPFENPAAVPEKEIDQAAEAFKKLSKDLNGNQEIQRNTFKSKEDPANLDKAI